MHSVVFLFLYSLFYLFYYLLGVGLALAFTYMKDRYPGARHTTTTRIELFLATKLKLNYSILDRSDLLSVLYYLAKTALQKKLSPQETDSQSIPSPFSSPQATK